MSNEPLVGGFICPGCNQPQEGDDYVMMQAGEFSTPVCRPCFNNPKTHGKAL